MREWTHVGQAVKQGNEEKALSAAQWATLTAWTKVEAVEAVERNRIRKGFVTFCWALKTEEQDFYF